MMIDTRVPVPGQVKCDCMHEWSEMHARVSGQDNY